MDENDVQLVDQDDVNGSDLPDETVFDGWDDGFPVYVSTDDDGAVSTDDDVDDNQADQPEPEPDTPEQPAEQTETEPTEEKVPEAEDADQYLELKHFDEVKKVSKAEAKTLAQKGMDYDRIRGKLSDAEANVAQLTKFRDFLEELRGNYPSIEALMDDTRARVLADKENISYEEAVAKVQTSAKQKEAEQRTSPEAINKLMREQSFETFLRNYPTVKAADIPKEVWDDVVKTNSLTASYANYQNKLLNAELEKIKGEIEILKQNKVNEDKAVGSLKTSGTSKNTDKYLEGWDDD